MSAIRYGIPLHAVCNHIVRPALAYIELEDLAGTRLVIGTGGKESGYLYAAQLEDGPALSWWQMEPATHLDIWTNMLAFPKFHRLADRLRGLAHWPTGMPPSSSLLVYPMYAAAMCRVQYYRSPKALPKAWDVTGMAKYWKQIYNTVLGAGTVAQALPHFTRACEEIQ